MIKPRAIQQLREFSKSTRRKGLRLFGRLGNLDNVVLVPNSDEARYYVRVQRGGSYDLGEYKSKIGLAMAVDTPVVLEQDPLNGEWVITAIDGVALGMASGADSALDVSQHQKSHAWGGSDLIEYIDIRQIWWPARVQPSETHGSIIVQSGIVKQKDVGYRYTTEETVSLTSYYPVSGTKYILLYLTPDGDIVVGDNSATVLEDLMHPPVGNWGIAAVRLVSGETLTWNDIVDLRIIGFDSIDSSLDLTDTPTSYGQVGQVLVVNSNRDGLRWASTTESLGGKTIYDHGSITVNLTNTMSITPGGQWVSVTVNLSESQEDTDYEVHLSAEDSPVMMCVASKTTESFEIYVTGVTDAGTLSPTIVWELVRWT